uniref:Uncharacterized protein n=1 Tax=Candidatus Kentrum sp. DK TaxID=2126562 RepID=A0A450T314_9GAMM|nr:MAG: hypothetical protein BECKDK2373C_GA0170839_108520 [Candidatus Kentron sp. DK]
MTKICANSRRIVDYLTRISLVPKLCLGTREGEAPLPGSEAELPGLGFPSRAWEPEKNRNCLPCRSGIAFIREGLLSEHDFPANSWRGGLFPAIPGFWVPPIPGGMTGPVNFHGQGWKKPATSSRQADAGTQLPGTVTGLVAALAALGIPTQSVGTRKQRGPLRGRALRCRGMSSV